MRGRRFVQVCTIADPRHATTIASFSVQRGITEFRPGADASTELICGSVLRLPHFDWYTSNE